MRQHTTHEQTTKLIELGLPKPKSIEVYRDGHCIPFVEQRWDYSIGELIEMLPTHYYTETKCFELSIAYSAFNSGWIVGGTRDPKDNTYGEELIDTLYDMVVKLKEEGVI